MIFTPRTLSNPQRCGDYLRALATKEEWASFDGLIICALQEVWAWKTGLFPHFLLRYLGLLEYIPFLGFVLPWLFQFVSMLSGTVLKCLPFTYDPKKQIAAALRHHTPFAYYDARMPLRCVLDNGLLLLSNHEAEKHGAFGFANHACDDSLAYKGFVYAYFKGQHTLALNTHLQARGDGTERTDQIAEITRFIGKFETLIAKEMLARQHNDAECLHNVGRKLKVIACGDWNIDMTEHEILRRASADLKLRLRRKTDAEIERVSDEDPELDPEVPSESIEIEIETDETANNANTKIEAEMPQRKKSRMAMCGTYVNLPKLFGDSFVKTNGCDQTSPSWGCLDHILANFEFVSFNEQICGEELRSKLSDHFLIKNEFTSLEC